MKRLQAGDIDYKEAVAASAIRNKIEMDGIKAEQNASVLKVGSHKWSGEHFIAMISCACKSNNESIQSVLCTRYFTLTK